MKVVRLFTLLAVLMYTFGCSIPPHDSNDLAVETIQTTEPVDTDCSYYYFLLGSHAENSQRFDEALQAYKNSLICDPDAEIVKNKIPLLLMGTGKKDEALVYLTKLIEEDPNKQVHKLLLADIYLQDKKYKKASKLYEQLLTQSPDSENLLLRIGTLNTQQGNYLRAVSAFEQLLTHNSTLFFPHLYLARLHFHLKNIDKAKSHYNKALLINWSQEIVHEVADFYKELNEHDEVLKLYNELVIHEPYDNSAHYGIVSALLMKGEDSLALQKLFEMRNLVSAPYTIDLISSKIYISNNKLADAKAHLLNLFDTSAESEGRFLLALLYAESDKEHALQYLALMNNDFLEYDDGVYLQYKLLTELNIEKEAITIFTARAANPKNRIPALFSMLSLLHKKTDREDKSLEILQEGASFYPDNNDLLFDLALQYEFNSQREIALSTMGKVLENQPDNPEALNFIGYLLADSNEQLTLALQYIEKAAKLKPGSGFILDSLGWVHFKRGDYQKAKEYLEQAITIENYDPHIFYHLGDLYAELNLLDIAKEKYIKALETIDDDKIEKEIQNKLDSLYDK